MSYLILWLKENEQFIFAPLLRKKMTQTARQLRSTHRQANLLAQEAWMAKEKGQFNRSLDLYQKAYQLEKEVAQGYLELLDAEPTRSIILRSAAVLAKECGELREAEKWLKQIQKAG